MNYEEIEAFLSIIETGSINRASKNLFVSQSAVSQRIQSLENELGVSLFIRKKGVRSIELTNKGNNFLPLAEEWRRLWKETGKIVSAPDRLTLSITCADSISSCVLHGLYKRLTSLDNPLYLNLETHRSYETYNLIEDRKMDIGFSLRQMHKKTLISTPSYSEKMYFISSPFADRYSNPVHPEKLNVHKEIFLPWSDDFRSWHTRWFGNFSSFYVYTDIISIMKSYFADGNFWAIVPYSAAYTIKKEINISIHDIENGPPDIICYMVEHGNPDSRSKESLKIFKNEYNKYLSEIPWLSVL